jgi:hypothetical protein
MFAADASLPARNVRGEVVVHDVELASVLEQAGDNPVGDRAAVEVTPICSSGTPRRW